MSLFSLFCQITCKIEAFFQNEILSEKNTKEKIFIGKKGGSISCRRTVQTTKNDETTSLII